LNKAIAILASVKAKAGLGRLVYLKLRYFSTSVEMGAFASVGVLLKIFATSICPEEPISSVVS